MGDLLLVPLHNRLFVRGHTRHTQLERVLGGLREHNIRMVVNVAIKPDTRLADVAVAAGVVYIHQPLSDGRRLRVRTVQELATRISCAMKQHSVLVHCDAGKNRSVLVAVSALRLHTHKTSAEIIHNLRRTRPQVLSNAVFERYLLSLDGGQPSGWFSMGVL